MTEGRELLPVRKVQKGGDEHQRRKREPCLVKDVDSDCEGGVACRRADWPCLGRLNVPGAGGAGCRRGIHVLNAE